MNELASAGQLRMSLLRVSLVVVPLVLFLGLVSGAVAGSGEDNPWFAALVKPSAMPAGYVFAVVWTLLYLLIGFALALIVAARRAAGRGIAIGLFCVQFLLNLAWSPVFFAAHEIGLAFALLLLMIVLTVVTILAFARVRRNAALLMLPYLGWLCFAAWLVHAIELLNPHGPTLAPGGVNAQI